jgi:hypothetical protein
VGHWELGEIGEGVEAVAHFKDCRGLLLDFVNGVMDGAGISKERLDAWVET